VQRSSESIGTIAAALAKAQAQLVNPEKSLVATIRSEATADHFRSNAHRRAAVHSQQRQSEKRQT
jgi:hypothetical protein